MTLSGFRRKSDNRTARSKDEPRCCAVEPSVYQHGMNTNRMKIKESERIAKHRLSSKEKKESPRSGFRESQKKLASNTERAAELVGSGKLGDLGAAGNEMSTGEKRNRSSSKTHSFIHEEERGKKMKNRGNTEQDMANLEANGLREQTAYRPAGFTAYPDGYVQHALALFHVTNGRCKYQTRSKAGFPEPGHGRLVP
ncbi:hypothetical protein GQ53DRAFT_773188 [Thozetella sp. PMI_491]|nr:hypothetical protein GQ53DRAFT_773188 [Thozetella sp. PMI_491]